MQTLKTGDYLPKQPLSYVACPKCSKEVSKLTELNICWDCNEKSRIDKQNEEMLILKLGEKGYREFTLEQFNREPYAETAFDFCSDFDAARDNLFLYGLKGSGKSHLAYAVARKWLLSNYSSVDIWKPPALFRHFRGIEADEETRRLDALTKKKILVIDDLGIGKDTEFALQILYEVIDNRIMSLRNGLIITSNLSLDQISQKMGDARTVDRITGLCKIIELSRPQSYRVERRKA